MKKIATFLLTMLFVFGVAAGCSTSDESKGKSEKAAAATNEESQSDSSKTKDDSEAVSTASKEEGESGSTESSDKKTTSYKDGTYEGTSDAGMHPGLKVSVVVKDGKIAEVSVLEHGETEGVGTKAVEQLPAKIIEAQSTDVEPVSGASMSSKAIKEAVDQALSQAK